MSESRFAIMPAAAIDDLRLTATDLRVLGVIAYHSSRDRGAYPKQQTIASRLKISRETVARAVQRLKKYGYVKVIAQKRRDGGQRENVYFVQLDPIVAPQDVVNPDEDGTLPAPPPCDPTITPPVIASVTPNKEEHNHKNNTPLPPGGEADALRAKAFRAIWAGWPEKGKERSAAPDICEREFVKACAKISPDALQIAAQAYIGKTKAQYVVGLHRFLKLRQYENFLPSPKAVERAQKRQLMRVDGKADDCLQAIIRRYGEVVATAWLHDATWGEALVHLPTEFQAQQVYQRFGPVLDLHGFGVTAEKAA